jgi:ribosomal protein S2
LHVCIYIINLDKTWEKLQLAASVIVAMENPQDIIVQSARPCGQWVVLKFDVLGLHEFDSETVRERSR